MVAIVVCRMTIRDPETYRKYTALTPPTVKRYGGRFLTRGDPIVTLEGPEAADRMVILEFPDAEAAQKWHADPEYVEATKFRLEASTGNSVLVQQGRDNQADPDARV